MKPVRSCTSSSGAARGRRPRRCDRVDPDVDRRRPRPLSPQPGGCPLRRDGSAATARSRDPCERGGRRHRRGVRRSTTIRWACPKPWSNAVGGRRPRARGQRARPTTRGTRALRGRPRCPRGRSRSRTPWSAPWREAEPTRRDRSGRRLAEPKGAGQDLQEDLRLRVAAHRAEHRGEAAVEGRSPVAGVRVWGGRRPGAYSAGWPSSTEKPSPRLCRLMPVDGSKRWLPKPEAFDWMSETPDPVAVDDAQARWCRRLSRRHDHARTRGRRSIASAPRREPRRCDSSASPSAAVVQHRGAVTASLLRRLDEEVRPRADRRGRRAGASPSAIHALDKRR